MAFVWTTISVGNPIKASEYGEIRSNADDTADNLSVPHYNWDDVAPSAGDKIKGLEGIELQDAIDYLDDENYCQTEHASYDVVVDGTENATYLNDDHVTNYASYISGVNNDRHGGYHTDYQGNY